MTEQEYIILSNKTRIADAISILNNVIYGEEYGIYDHELALALSPLDEIYESLGKLAQIDD